MATRDDLLHLHQSPPKPRPKRTRHGYRYAVEWIALNDDPGSDDSTDPEVIAGYVSVHLVADLFGKDSRDVAVDVCYYRRRGDAECAP